MGLRLFKIHFDFGHRFGTAHPRKRNHGAQSTQTGLAHAEDCPGGRGPQLLSLNRPSYCDQQIGFLYFFHPCFYLFRKLQLCHASTFGPTSDLNCLMTARIQKAGLRRCVSTGEDKPRIPPPNLPTTANSESPSTESSPSWAGCSTRTPTQLGDDSVDGD